MNINAIRQEIESLRQEARSIAEKADTDAAAASRFTAIEARVAELRAAESRAAFLDEADRRASGVPVGGTGDARLDALAEEVGLLDTVRAQMGATDAGAGRAREVSAELARRSGRSPQGVLFNMNAAERRTLLTTNTGGTLVPTDYRPELFIDRLRNATKVRALGATVLSGLSGNVTIPKRTGSVAMGWVNEDQALPVSDPSFGSVGLTPKHAGCISEWSRQMIMQASPDVENLARADMAAQLAEVLDAAAIAGTGLNAQPTGILNTEGVTIIPAGPEEDGTGPNYFTFVDLVGAIDDGNADGTSTGFLTNTKVRRAAMKMLASSGEPIGLDIIFQGKNVQYSNIVPSNGTKGTGTNLSTAIYGKWSDLIIGLWSELDILVNPFVDPAYSKGNVRIRAMMTCDIAVRHAASFAACTDMAV